MKICIIDTLGLTYDGTTLLKRGLGGSESAVIYIARELVKLNFDVTVFNNCIDGTNSAPGFYDGVKYVDNTNSSNFSDEEFDIAIVSRTVIPFLTNSHSFLHKAKKRILWLHDTFIEGDRYLEDLIVSKKIDYIFTLSDWHSSYIMNCDHGKRRNYEVLKPHIFQTRNGAVKYDVDLTKDRNQFIYNASATKGMVPLVEDIWPRLKQYLPDAKLNIIGGYYRFRENAAPDEQENTVQKYAKDQRLKDLGITFTGILPQNEIAKLLGKAYMMLYPGAFPETFGISSLESLLYKTPLVTTRFGALEETALDLACYKIDYAIEPNSLFQTIDKNAQVEKFVQTVLYAINNPYLHQQKQEYCNVVDDIAGWDTVALQWKQFFYSIMGEFLSVDEYRAVSRINEKVQRVFGRVTQSNVKKYSSYGPQRKIVVISPFRNAEEYIEKNIRSVAQQNYQNYFHYLIDDFSTDRSFAVASETIEKISKEGQILNLRVEKINETPLPGFKNNGAIYNQLKFIEKYCNDDDIVMLLDGDDWLVNNNTIFHYYNDLYNQGYEFTYGSMWSLADNIPLVAQEYPKDVKEQKRYREHLFNWKIPYTHLRTCLAKHFFDLDKSKFKDANGKWMKSGHDNPLFYELIERVDPTKIYCNKEIVCMYNDKNPLNDYKVNSIEQNRNANLSYKSIVKEKFSVIIPTMWRELSVFERALQNYVHHDLVDEIIIIDNDSKNAPDWNFDTEKIIIHRQEKNIFVNPAWNLGVSLAKNKKLIIANDDIEFDISLLDKIHPRVVPENGVHGIITGEAIFGHPQSTDYSIDFKEWKPGDNIHSFGQLMFLHKDNWQPIDERMKIYFGDDVIFQWHLYKGLKNYLIYNIKFNSPMASTTKDTTITAGKYEEERPYYEEWAMKHPLKIPTTIEAEYEIAKTNPSDINEHVSILKELCDRVESVTEFGVRTGVSTRALLMSSAKKIRSYDLYIDQPTAELFDLVKDKKDARYEIGNSLTIDIEPTDLLFIDTDHTYEQVKRELHRHSAKVNKYICFHDTHSYGIHVNDPHNNPGILPAILEFMEEHPEWKVDYFTTKNNGFTVLKREGTEITRKKQILVAIPTNKNIEAETFKSIYDLEVPEGYETHFQMFHGYQIDQIRNLIAEWAKSYDYLFSVDSDIILPKDSLKKMLKADKDVISGLYIQRKPEQKILEVYGLNDAGGVSNIPIHLIENLGIVEIMACGMGCALIKSEVFRNIAYPHFYYKSALTMQDTVSEDVFFCLKAREHGYRIWADPSIKCDHIGSTKFSMDSEIEKNIERVYAQDMLPKDHVSYLEQMSISPKVIYDVGSSVLHWQRHAKRIWPNASIYLFDANEDLKKLYSKHSTAYHLGVLSDEDRKFVEFYHDPYNLGGNSYYKENTAAYGEAHKVQKAAYTLDTIVEKNGWQYPDLIKMDIQGAELDVLKGAKKCLENCNDLILECQHREYNSGAPNVTQVINYLKENGFELISNFTRGEFDGDYHFKRSISYK